MSQYLKNSSHYTKSDLFAEAPIFQCTTVFDRVYTPEITVSELYSHDVPEISIVVSGSGFHQILNQAVPCCEGDVYIISPDIPHGYFRSESSQPLTVKCLMFDVADWFDGDIAHKDNPHYCFGVFNDSLISAYAMPSAQSREHINELFSAIDLEISDKKYEWREAVKSYLTLMLITVGRYVNGAVKNIITANSKEWGIVSSALRIIASDYADCSLTLERIADSLYVSKSHLSRLFKRMTGESFSEHLRRLRIEHASLLLCETDMTVEEIVSACGLRDVPTFYRTFGEIMNMTPNRYRMKFTSRKTHSEAPTGSDNHISEISDCLQHGKYRMIRELISSALSSGCTADDILKKGLLRGMDAVGSKFRNNEAFIPEVLVAARAFNAGMQVLRPYFSADERKSAGRACIGTVEGDLHDIGKNLVRMMLEGKGIEVIDLGTDISAVRFVDTAVEHDCRLICASALLSTTMPVMRDIVSELERRGLHDKIKLMIGGAPVTDEFRREIGADFYTSDAASAADAAVEYLNSLKAIPHIE